MLHLSETVTQFICVRLLGKNKSRYDDAQPFCRFKRHFREQTVL